jgi:hypothetical protein
MVTSLPFRMDKGRRNDAHERRHWARGFSDTVLPDGRRFPLPPFSLSEVEGQGYRVVAGL